MMRLFDRGFTLVETLAAFAILAVVMIQLFSGVARGARNDIRSEFELAATRVAKSELARLGGDAALTPGTRSGVSQEGLSWTVTLTPHAGKAGAVASGVWADITVSGPGASVTLTTFRLIGRGGQSP